MKLIDIGINLCKKDFKNNWKDIVASAQKSNVSKIILTGIDLNSSIQSMSKTLELEGVLYSTAGIHPHYAITYNKDVLFELSELLKVPSVVSVGECGLDFNRDLSPRNIQEKCFDAHLELSVQCKKPLFLHEREAFKRFQDIIKPYSGKLPNSVVHCFTGSLNEAKSYLDQGFYLGFTGAISNLGRFKQLKEVVKYVPLDRLMIETDSPYMYPKNIPLQKMTHKPINTPSNLIWVAKSVAEYKGISVEEVAEVTSKNSIDFFKL